MQQFCCHFKKLGLKIQAQLRYTLEEELFVRNQPLEAFLLLRVSTTALYVKIYSANPGNIYNDTSSLVRFEKKSSTLKKMF
jgi:hypothetical protein